MSPPRAAPRAGAEPPVVEISLLRGYAPPKVPAGLPGSPPKSSKAWETMLRCQQGKHSKSASLHRAVEIQNEIQRSMRARAAALQEEQRCLESREEQRRERVIDAVS